MALLPASMAQARPEPSPPASTPPGRSRDITLRAPSLTASCVHPTAALLPSILQQRITPTSTASIRTGRSLGFTLRPQVVVPDLAPEERPCLGIGGVVEGDTHVR